jgi:hypothetical protein
MFISIVIGRIFIKFNGILIVIIDNNRRYCKNN